MKLTSIALTAVVAVAVAGPAQARAIKIVGSSTVFPYTQAVSEEYANNSGNEAPIVEFHRYGWRHEIVLRRRWRGTSRYHGRIPCHEEI